VKVKGLLIYKGRIIPIMPLGIITLAASISNVNSTIFIIVTLMGKASSITLEVLVNYDIINIYNNWIRLTMTVIGLIFLTLIIRKENRGN
jgi:uncharacterized membrane protein YdjX (TVP38/TMEM64 family)